MRRKVEVTEEQAKQYDANRELYRSARGFYGNAYPIAVNRYRLRAAQRDELDRSPFYAELLQACGKSRWAEADAIAFQAGLSQHLSEDTDPRVRRPRKFVSQACQPCNCGCESR